MKLLTYFLVLIFIFSHSFLFSQSHNQVEVDLERIKKDIIDLQKFVYKNSDSSTTQQNENSELENLNQLLGSIADKLSSLEIQMNDMKDDISNLYLLYTSPQFDTNNLVNSTQELNIDESSSKIVSEKNKQTYRNILKKINVKPENFLMVGNSLKSDILPVLEIGGEGAYIPYKHTWEHEKIDMKDYSNFLKLENISNLTSVF